MLDSHLGLYRSTLHAYQPWYPRSRAENNIGLLRCHARSEVIHPSVVPAAHHLIQLHFNPPDISCRYHRQYVVYISGHTRALWHPRTQNAAIEVFHSPKD